MSRTPAAELARLKVTWRGWYITRRADGTCLAVARNHPHTAVNATSAAHLDAALFDAEKKHPIWHGQAVRA